MPFTGLFQLIEVQGDMAGAPPRFTKICAAQAVCEGCRQFSYLTEFQGIHSIPGGAVISCPGCGARQAISNARFDEFFLRSKSEECRELGAGARCASS